MNLAKLFETRPRWDPKLVPYKTWRAELDAIAAGRKGMSIFGFTSRDLAGADYRFLIEQALKRDLVFAHANWSADLKSFRVYVTRADELWRIPAHLALWETATDSRENIGWGASSEALEGLLLGYTAAERARWLAARRDRFAGDRGVNVYALLDRAHKEAVIAAGKRYLGAVSELRLFAHDQLPLSSRARRLVPAGTTIARFALDWPVYRRVFGDPIGRVVTASISDELAPMLHAGMRSNVQFLTSRGWA
jgi:hypothetical protein